MSAIAEFPARAAGGWRGPSFGRVFWAVLAGEVQAAIVLWVCTIPIAVLRLAPVGGPSNWVWLPWRIDGVWALVAAAGWAYLICAVVAWFVAGSLAHRGVDLVATGWLRVAIALSGYGAMAVGRTAGARILIAVVLGTILIRALVLRADGHERSWPLEPDQGIRVLAVLAAVLVSCSYGATHAFEADGSSGAYGSQPVYVRVGQPKNIAVGLSQLHFGAQIQAATLTGPGSANVRVTAMILSLGNPAELPSRSFMRQLPTRYRAAYAVKLTHFPYALPSGQDLWVNANVALRSCALPTTINTLRLRYTVLGIETSASIPIQSPLTLSCPQ